MHSSPYKNDSSLISCDIPAEIIILQKIHRMQNRRSFDSQNYCILLSVVLFNIFMILDGIINKKRKVKNIKAYFCSDYVHWFINSSPSLIKCEKSGRQKKRRHKSSVNTFFSSSIIFFNPHIRMYTSLSIPSLLIERKKKIATIVSFFIHYFVHLFSAF